MELVTNAIWENLLFMITTSVHVSESALKAVLLKKNFTISHGSTNKKYNSKKVHDLIEKDVIAVWMLLGQLPDLLQIPFEITVSLVFIFKFVGIFALPGFIFYGLAIALNVYATKTKARLNSLIQVVDDKRMVNISEAFAHNKLYKLYGWVNSFCNTIKSAYSEELKQKSWVLKFDGLVAAC